MVRFRNLVAEIAVLLAIVIAQPAWGRGPLTFEERVRAQEAIERVYYAHRIWPKENPASKPPFDALVPGEVIEAKVADSLKKCAALDVIWQRPVTPRQLQAEMERMARDSKDPALLRELFAALGDDPILIAECLARPTLAERSVRHFFASDERVHGAPRERAEALARSLELNIPLVSGAEYQRILFIPGGEEGADRALSQDGPRPVPRVTLPDSEFERIQGQAPAPGAGPIVREDAERVSVLRTLTSYPGALEVESWSFPKLPFETWWACEREALPLSLRYSPEGSVYSLPRPASIPPCGDTWRALPENTPSPRTSHTMVWTGTEILVWGGADGALRTNTGGRYSPATDTWYSTSTASPCPSARDSHSAVWTGTEMIVWGGWDGSRYFNDGARYDPLTDSWAATSTTGLCPISRMWHTAVWTGSSMIVWGGFSGSNLNSGGVYDPAGNTWSIVPILAQTPYARWGHAAVWTGSEMLVWGGYLGSGLFANSGGLFDPATISWRPTSAKEDTPSPRRDMSYTWTGTELLVWGGYSGTCVGTGGRYDLLSDTWKPMAAEGAPSPRANLTGAAWTGSEMILWGGLCGLTTLGDGARYSPATDSWKSIAASNAPKARQGHQAAWTGEEMIVWGGNDGLVNLDTGARYAPASDSWVPTPVDAGSPAERENHTAVWTGADLIVWGGFLADGTAWHDLDSGGSYSPATDSWTATSQGAQCPTGRYAHSAVWTGSEMIVWGGHRYASGMDMDVSTGARYNPASGTWATTSAISAPAQRNSHAAVWTGEAMVIWGGYQVLGGFPYPLREGGRYYPATDSWLRTSLAEGCPTARAAQGVWTGHDLLIWGGGTVDTQYGDGALYDPRADTWSPIPASPQTPSPRKHLWSAWTGDAFLVWGGEGSSDPDGTCKNTGGIWDPGTGTWRPTSTQGGCPAGRQFNFGIAPWSGRELLVWGGANALDYFQTGGRYNPVTDTWIPTATLLAPPPRNRHTTTWCGSNLVVFGGLGPTVTERSGSIYTILPPSLSCSATASPGSGAVPLTVAFNAAATPEGCEGAAASLWTFGDGASSGLASPSHTYEAPGTYAWTFTASLNGATCASSGEIVVSPPCTLTCTADVSPASGLAPLTVQCTASAEASDCGGSASFAWNFGDGEISDLPSPAHIYSAPGTYDWSVTVSQDGKSCTRTGTVTVVAPCTLACSASAAPPSGPAPLTVAFTAEAISTGCDGEPSYTWAYGDGDTSAQQSPTHTYSEPGMYTWSVTASQDGKSCTQTGTVAVAAPCELSCSASAIPTSGQSPLAVTFTAEANAIGCQGDPAFAWTFGDGAASAQQNPSHAYARQGTYAWSVTVTQGGRSCTKTGSVTVTGIPGDCDGDGSVSIGEVQKSINMFLGIIPPGCGVDCNGDGQVSIGEVQKVINAFLGFASACS